MAKARRKLRRQLMKKAKKGYLTPGEREDLMQLDREVNKANRQAAAVGVPALSAALAMASRSGALYGMGDSLSGLFDGMGERRERKEEEEPIETADANQEVSGDDQLRKLQEENNKELQEKDNKEPSTVFKPLEGPTYRAGAEELGNYMSDEERVKMMAARTANEQNAEDITEPFVGLPDEVTLDAAEITDSPSYGVSGNREVAREKFIRDLQENNPELLEKYGRSRYDKYGNYINIGQSTLDPEIYNLVQQGDEYRFNLKPEFSGAQPSMRGAEDVMDPNFGQMPQRMGGYTPFLSSLRNKFQKRLTGRR